MVIVKRKRKKREARIKQLKGKVKAHGHGKSEDSCKVTSHHVHGHSKKKKKETRRKTTMAHKRKPGKKRTPNTTNADRPTLAKGRQTKSKSKLFKLRVDHTKEESPESQEKSGPQIRQMP